jgi:hypothetical protein
LVVLLIIIQFSQPLSEIQQWQEYHLSSHGSVWVDTEIQEINEKLFQINKDENKDKDKDILYTSLLCTCIAFISMNYICVSCSV